MKRRRQWSMLCQMAEQLHASDAWGYRQIAEAFGVPRKYLKKKLREHARWMAALRAERKATK